MARHLFWLGLIGLLVGGLGLAPAEARPPPKFADVPHHYVSLRLDLEGHRIVATDRISFASTAPTPLLIRLNPDLEILSAAATTVDGDTNTVPVKPVDDKPGFYEFTVAPNATDVEIHYAGVIYDQVEKSEDLSWVVGDNTKGVIDENGVYLSGASGFIPRIVGNRLAAFDITTIVPSPYLTVTQGSVPKRSAAYANPKFEATDVVFPSGSEKQRGDRTYTVSVSQAVVPTDSVSLVAGKFVTKSKEVEGVTLTTYFYEQDAGAMDLWLANCAETVKRYAPILGAYPHPKFDIVTNFFQSGYGMPGWTLLGDRVIRYVTAKAQRQGGKIPPGYLDHEYVHGWYGNGLFVDYATGNWCEAITTYFANYLAKELESKEAGQEHRRGVLEKFAIRVHGEGDYALRKFVQKTEDKDNDIGYGKGSMLFHMLRKQVGDKTFFDTVLAFTRANVGKVVRWEDWFEAFAKASDQDITAHIGPYLERPGLPSVTLTKAEPSQGKNGQWAVNVGIETGPKDVAPWPVNVPVRITLADGTTVDREAVLEGHTYEAGYADLAAKPIAVELDPHFHLLRRIPDADIPHCLNRTLETPGGTVYVEANEQAFQAVAGRIARSKGFALKQGKAEITGPTIVLSLADPEKGVVAGGKTWTGEDVAVLQTSLENGHPVTRFTALSKAMTPRAMYAPYYGWDTYVVFKGHSPIARGIGRGEETSTRRKLASLDVSGITKTLETLCSKEFEGRRPGTAGHAKANRWLWDWLLRELRNVSAIAVQVPIARRASGRDLVIRLGDREEVWKDAYRPLALDPTKWVARFVPLNELGRLRLEGTDPLGWALAASKVKRAGQHPVLIVEPTPEAAAAVAAWLDTPEDLTEEAEALLARPGRDGKARPRPCLESWIAGRRSRTLPLASEAQLRTAVRSAPHMIVLAEG
ncbi:MAG: M1 family aminopeptidase, partial [Planctomycetota bacterium]|nr:M1 family aminopeptidase [Planctomycetota bacterium]